MERRKNLEKLDFIVLDNSICESAVGQLRGHILEGKIRIYHEVKKCRMTSAILVASPSKEESIYLCATPLLYLFPRSIVVRFDRSTVVPFIFMAYYAMYIYICILYMHMYIRITTSH